MRDFLHIDINRTASTSIRKALDLQETPKHRTAAMYLEEIGWQRYKRRWVFTVVRNPFDKVLCQWVHRRGSEGMPSFKEYVARRYVLGDRSGMNGMDDDRLFWPQCDWLTWQGRWAVDYVARFEQLEAGWEVIQSMVGANQTLPHLNQRDHDHYSTYYDPESRAIVADHFREDLDRFGYQFEVRS